MSVELSSLIIPAFIAGLLTFLAPCTFPLVPGYLGFISGASLGDLQSSDPLKRKRLKQKIVLNGLMYVLGFSLVFIALGSLFGVIGSFFNVYRVWISRIGGLFVIFFGLYLLGVFQLPLFSFLQREKRIHLMNRLHPGKPSSSFLFGMTFAFGWTPCVGPVLGSILILASHTATLWKGTLLLTIFSLGLGLPFLVIALLIGHATRYMHRLGKYLNAISIVGGVFLVFLGVLVFSNHLGIWVATFYRWFDFLALDRLLQYL